MNKHIPSQMTQQWKQNSIQGLDHLWKENGAENSSPKFVSTTQQRVKNKVSFADKKLKSFFSLYVEQQLFSIRIQCFHPLEQFIKETNRMINNSNNNKMIYQVKSV